MQIIKDLISKKKEITEVLNELKAQETTLEELWNKTPQFYINNTEEAAVAFIKKEETPEVVEELLSKLRAERARMLAYNANYSSYIAKKSKLIDRKIALYEELEALNEKVYYILENNF